MHRALEILDLQDSIFQYADNHSLSCLVRICQSFFHPAVRVLWARLHRLRVILDILSPLLGSKEEYVDHLSLRRRQRFWTYCRHIAVLEYLINDTPITEETELVLSHTCAAASIRELCSLQPVGATFPALRTVLFRVSSTEGYTAALELLTGAIVTLQIEFYYPPPDSDEIWPIIRDRCPKVTLLALFITDAGEWPTKRSLEGLEELKQLHSLAIECHSLELEHVAVLSALPALVHLRIIAPYQQSEAERPNLADCVRDLVPKSGRNPFGRLRSLNLNRSTVGTCLRVLRQMASPTFDSLCVLNVFTNPITHEMLVSTIVDRCPNLEMLVLSLIHQNNDEDIIDADEGRWRLFQPLLSCRKMTRFDFIGTSHLRIFSWTNEHLESFARSWPLLQELRLITFDYSYHYDSALHIPGVTLAGIIPLSQYCPHLKVLQLELNMEDPAALPDISSLSPLSVANLQRFLVAWSRFPKDDDAIGAVATFIHSLWPKVIVGWGRWSHDLSDVPDGQFEGHVGFPETDFAGIHEASRKAKLLAGAVETMMGTE